MRYKVLKPFVDENGILKLPDQELSCSDNEWESKFYQGLLTHDYIGEKEETTLHLGVIATSKLAGVEIADKDYVEGDKKYFTFDEALKVEKKLKDGWRLPTRHEWALICEEFANDKNGRLSAKLLMEKLGLGLDGYMDNDGAIWSEDREGNYWSRSSYINPSYAYFLNFNASDVYPSNNTNRSYGFPLRCVREIKPRGHRA